MRKKKLTRTVRSAASKRAAGEPKRKTSLALENAPPSPSDGAFPIVGIGASAGGLEAIIQLLQHLPSQTGMAFTLVQHLDPTHESALTALLSRQTQMRVSEARNNMELRPNQVYVIPPNKLMGISRRRLKLFPRRSAESNLPVDVFFRSLAEEEGSRAIGVILSGNGSDGTQGLLAIKTAGGITIAQSEKTAKYPAMPGNAITAGCVDFVLPPERIAGELARIAGHPYVTPGPLGARVGPEPPAEEKAFEDILTILRQRMAVDFSQYKYATLQRRIQRRTVLHKFETRQEYAAHLRDNLNEVKDLFNDILIHVTGFFRDPGVFTGLKRKLFPRIVKGKRPEEPIRVWVPGCSTGEEAYSIAIALIEFMSERRLRHPLQIFGTDILDSALDKARAGVYGDNIEADVGAERLRRFFGKTDRGHRITKGVREVCIFARQNVVADPPFSSLDLISCRNVIIYLSQGLQRKVMPMFHYALKPNGFLMLGASETVGGFSDLFALVDNRAKFYAKKTVHLRPAVTFGRSVSGAPAQDRSFEGPAAAPSSPTLSDLQVQADRILLSNYTPPGVIINKHMEVLQFRGRTGPYLEHAHGEASLNLLKMARESVLLDLRTAVTRAIKQETRVLQSGVRTKQNGHSLELSIEVVPYSVPPSKERFYLVLFRPLGAPPETPAEPGPRGKKGRKRSDAGEESTTRLQEELAATRESLQAIIEEREATTEELRSANEESMSSIEELQSTNEELETAKEELQSTNEELTTLNDELESRNSELEHVNNDLHNVLASVNIPILILGPDLRIRRFTGVAEKLFNLIPGDVGRPITNINLPLELPDLSKLVLEVIDNLTARELEVKDHQGHWWSVRVRPYKTTDNKIDGAVVALVDINLVKTTAQRASERAALAEAVINTVPRPVLLLDKELNVEAANQAFYRAFQVAPEDTIARPIYQLGDGQWNIPRLRNLLEEIMPRNSDFKDFQVEHDFPAIGRRKMMLEARRLVLKGDGQQVIMLTINDT